MHGQITCTLSYSKLKEFENMSAAFLITINYFKTDEEKQRLLDFVQARYNGQGDTTELIKEYLGV